jgi:hypothetical protein
MSVDRVDAGETCNSDVAWQPGMLDIEPLMTQASYKQLLSLNVSSL